MVNFVFLQVMQFGRIDTNAYTLDFQYPFTAVQAFAVALANVTQRLKWQHIARSHLNNSCVYYLSSVYYVSSTLRLILKQPKIAVATRIIMLNQDDIIFFSKALLFLVNRFNA